MLAPVPGAGEIRPSPTVGTGPLAPAVPVAAEEVSERPSGRGDRLLVAASMLVLASATGLRLPVRYWSDEGISVGIASQPASRIPGLLSRDGSPPLYYEMLHAWMALAGRTEVATHSLSLIAAVLTVPALWWTARRVAGRPAARVAVVLAAGSPLLLWYGAESRMYTMLALAGTLTAGAFVRALGGDGRWWMVPAIAGGAVLAWLHDWGVFFVVGLAVAGWLVAWRRRDRRGGVAVSVFAGATALLYLPWVPTLLHQLRHTGAPWATLPSLPAAVHDPLYAAFGSPWPVVIAVVVAAAGARRRWAVGAVRAAPDPGDAGLRLLAGAATLTVAIGWAAGRAGGSWAPRYLAVTAGPLLVLAAAAIVEAGRRAEPALRTKLTSAAVRAEGEMGSRPGRSGAVILAFAGALVACVSGVAPVVLGGGHGRNMKSDIAELAALLRPQIRPGDVVIVDQVSIVAVVSYYLGPHYVYVDPTGLVAAPFMVNWNDLVARLRAARPTALVDELVSRLRPGQHLFVVGPMGWPASAPTSYGVLVAAQGRALVAAAESGLSAEVGPTIGAGLRRDAYAVRAVELSRP